MKIQKTTRSLIGQMMLGSRKKFIVYGSVRGLVAQVDTYEQAETELDADQEGCHLQGGYSDARIFRGDANGHWEIAWARS